MLTFSSKFHRDSKFKNRYKIHSNQKPRARYPLPHKTVSLKNLARLTTFQSTEAKKLSNWVAVKQLVLNNPGLPCTVSNAMLFPLRHGGPEVGFPLLGGKEPTLIQEMGLSP